MSVRRGNPESFDLRAFVRANFTTARSDTIRSHIEAHCGINSARNAVKPPERQFTRWSLPRPYAVPGGRFQELYYWRFLFRDAGPDGKRRVSGRCGRWWRTLPTSLRPTVSFRMRIARHYLTRSQPPFFSLMLDLLAEKEGDDVYVEFRGALEKEYRFWMDENRGRVVSAEGFTLNRYHDDGDAPRDEQYATDVTLAKRPREVKELYRSHVRSAAESG